MSDHLERLYPYVERQTASLNLMGNRLGNMEKPKYYLDTVSGANKMVIQLKDAKGGFSQQDRMIRDKRRSLDKAMLYSYQSAWVKKHYYDFEALMDGVREENPVRALINPNKLKQDYDDKIISIGFEHDFKPGDIFEWCNTGTYWLIYLQDLTELAYFRGDIRKCSYEIEWTDDQGEKQRSFIAVRGPVETKINFIQKHGISVDNPNHTLSILMPKNKATQDYFKRYAKFYLQGDDICWRVTAIDDISTPGILEVTAIEYYANETEDDIDNGIVGGLVKPIENPNTEVEEADIVGETFIKVKKTYSYLCAAAGEWHVDRKYPVVIKVDPNDATKITLKWDSSYSGQFELSCGDYSKTIMVESLF